LAQRWQGLGRAVVDGDYLINVRVDIALILCASRKERTRCISWKTTTIERCMN